MMFELIINKFSTNYSVYNIGTGIGYSINQIIEILSKEIGKKPFIEYLESRDIDVKENVLDIGRFKNEFRFSPNNLIKNGIKKYLEYLDEV